MSAWQQKELCLRVHTQKGQALIDKNALCHLSSVFSGIYICGSRMDERGWLYIKKKNNNIYIPLVLFYMLELWQEVTAVILSVSHWLK